MNLRRLSDNEYNEVSALAEPTGVSLDECPTCGARRTEVSPGVWGWENGTYRYQGKDNECNCEQQMALRRQYLLARIPVEYQKLDWMAYDGSPKATKTIAEYLFKWKTAKGNGMGLEFGGRSLGVGKTWAATYVAKELIKQGERVYFVPFGSIISSYQKSNAEEIENTLKSTTVLVLDEVGKPSTAAQNELFSSRFEDLIRHRTNYNLPTILTTNLEEEELLSYYPRPYSLLSHKQIRVQIEGDDARKGKMQLENIEIFANEETRPLV